MLSWWKIVTLFLFLSLPFYLSVRSLTRDIKANGVKVWNVDRKVALRSIAIMALPIGLAMFGSPLKGFWGAVTVVVALVLAVATIVAVINLPSNRVGDWIDRLAWGDPARPVRIFAPVVWAQFGAALVFILFVGIFWIVTSIGGGSSNAANVVNAPSTGTSAPAAPSKTPTGPSAIGPTSSSPSASASAKTNNCGAPALQTFNGEVPFGAQDVQVCKDGTWKAWSGATPAKVTVTAWTEQSGYGYGTIVVNGVSYLIRTTSYKSSSS